VARTAEQRAQAAFRDAQARWREALEAHRLAPPDAEFSARLAALANAAQVEADACRAAEAAGFEWPPHRASSSKPPHELQPGSGRRAPRELWARFDGAVAELNRAATGTDLLGVADAYEQLGSVAGELAHAVEAAIALVGFCAAAGCAARRSGFRDVVPTDVVSDAPGEASYRLSPTPSEGLRGRGVEASWWSSAPRCRGGSPVRCSRR
jgi:hypothetical protein